MDDLLVETLINLLLVSLLTSIANEIAPIGSGIDKSQNGSRVDRVLVEALID